MLNLGSAITVQLAARADEAVGRVLAGETGMAPPLDAREALGATVSAGLPGAADAWLEILEPEGLALGLVGAFSFGAPIVEFQAGGASHRCSIADLMIVVDDLTGRERDRRALLLRTRQTVANDAPCSDAERSLDEGWPAFRFVDEAENAGPTPRRRLGGETRFSCLAQVDLMLPARTWRMVGCTVTPGMAEGVSLGRLIVEMARGRAGRRAPEFDGDDWSRTLNDLLVRTASATMDGLRPHQRFRSLMTHQGQAGTGFVVFENRTDLEITAALAGGHGRAEGSEGPLSVTHVTFRKALVAPAPRGLR